MKNTSVNKKGIIRTGAVAPTVILIALVAIYLSFFFDANLRRGLEYVLTHVNGAEVDVHHLRTSFIHGSIEIRDIEVTDREHPERNLVQVGQVRFAMVWDALLRAKVAIDDASILNIQALVPRHHPGYVIPPTPPSDKPSQLQKVEEEALGQARKQYNGNFLGDVAGLLSDNNAKDQLKNLEGRLKSDVKIKALQKDLADKKNQWDTRLKQLPQSQELKVYGERIKTLKFDFNNPGVLAKSIGEAQKIINEAQGKVQLIAQTQSALKADLALYTQQYKDLEKLVQEDLHDLQDRLKLPNIDAKEFSQQLFMTMIEKKLGGMAKYLELIRHYMPAKKTDAQKKEVKAAEVAAQIIPPKRGAGKTYRFPITTGYPLFWLKHAAISSELANGDFSGNLKGEIRDVTSDPPRLGRPTLILLAGDFPTQEIHGLEARITIDHRTDVPKEIVVMKVASFPVVSQTLSDSPDVRLILSQAVGTSEIHGEVVNDQITLNLRNKFTGIKFDLAAKNPVVQDMLENVLKEIPKVDVNADVVGSLHNFEVHINSNLGTDLANSFQKQLHAKIEQAKAQLLQFINSKIGVDRDQLKSQLSALSGDLIKNIDAKKGDADKIVRDTQNQLNSAKGDSSKSLEEQGKQLLKGFGFGG